MTKTITLVFWTVAVVGVCSAAPSSIPTKTQPVLMRNEHVYDKSGQFSLAYALDDGTSQLKRGYLVMNEDENDYVMNQEGSYTYISPEGVNVKMSYTADKDGFKVSGYPQ